MQRFFIKALCALLVLSLLPVCGLCAVEEPVEKTSAELPG